MPPKKRLDDDGLGIDDLSLPKSMVARLAKGVLPANSQIQKDAMLALTRSATVFVNYLAATSNDRAILNNKKTIGHDDVFASLKELEFASFLPRCQQELERYQALQCTKRNDYRKRIRDEQKKETKPEGEHGAAGLGEGTAGNADGITTVIAGVASPTEATIRDVNGDRPLKKAKMENGAEDEHEEFEDDAEDDEEVEEEEEDDEDEDEDDDNDDGPDEGQGGAEGQDDENEIDGDTARPGPEQDGSESEID